MSDEQILREVWEANDPAYWSAAHTWAQIQASLRPGYSLTEVMAKLRTTHTILPRGSP